MDSTKLFWAASNSGVLSPSRPYFSRKWPRSVMSWLTNEDLTLWIEGALGIISISAVRFEVTRMSYGRSHRGSPASWKIDWNVRMSCIESSSCRQSSPSLTMTAAKSHPGLVPCGDRLRMRSFLSAHFSPYTSIVDVASPSSSAGDRLFARTVVGVSPEPEGDASVPLGPLSRLRVWPSAISLCLSLAAVTADVAPDCSFPWYSAPDTMVAIGDECGGSVCCSAMCNKAS
mmetsp:Transcript_15619/g.44514  ORF Transcript_15619/g.44514 Transcript_15619/m.44514 type:complete len:230 (-) Transcript_15619:70-759(-)